MINPSHVYEELQTSALSGRELEAALLARAARKLSRCAQSWDGNRPEDFREKLDEALRFNQKLWTFLQVELSNPENPLPQPVRTNLLRLSRYVDQKSLDLFAGGTLDDLLSLSRINEQIAAGLLEGVGNDAGPETVSPVDASLDLKG